MRGDQPRSTSCIENQPRLPVQPFGGEQSRRSRSRGDRGRCESARSYPTPQSNPIVCVPGIIPARVDDMSIAALEPGADHGVAQQQRRARRRVALGGVMRLVNPGAVLRLRRISRAASATMHLEQVDADREVGRRHDAEPAAAACCPIAGQPVGTIRSCR